MDDRCQEKPLVGLGQALPRIPVLLRGEAACFASVKDSSYLTLSIHLYTKWSQQMWATAQKNWTFPHCGTGDRTQDLVQTPTPPSCEL